MTTICQLFYISSATRDFDDEGIESILDTSRRNNAKLDVTGCLLYSGRQFAQVLEGHSSAVTALFRTIAADPRHGAIMMLVEGYRPDRAYGEWSMGYLRDFEMADALAALSTGSVDAAAKLADVMARMRLDTTMGALH